MITIFVHFLHPRKKLTDSNTFRGPKLKRGGPPPPPSLSPFMLVVDPRMFFRRKFKRMAKGVRKHRLIFNYSKIIQQQCSAENDVRCSKNFNPSSSYDLMSRKITARKQTLCQLVILKLDQCTSIVLTRELVKLYGLSFGVVVVVVVQIDVSQIKAF
jgi:hypothetical protein